MLLCDPTLVQNRWEIKYHEDALFHLEGERKFIHPKVKHLPLLTINADCHSPL
jgi:hypothetical protein